MTQNPVTQPQCSTAQELWAAYDGLKDKEDKLHQRYQDLLARYQRAHERAEKQYQRSQEAYRAYVALYDQRRELFDAAMQAGRDEASQESVKLAA